ncbi:MAG: hypothetical protein HN742_25785 [Lentisphaerae bacterium]|nr:hypothetical protein [Lentisphaerota bacterium]MBT5604785.1 hypothetical protein [Lentisphaerota bacterium]MBT7057029.1 hypothetical protein [Lentisphaerota bacterium]MBT7845312.1 hypothetical protein [Lentisphaerota bacterium]
MKTPPLLVNLLLTAVLVGALSLAAAERIPLQVNGPTGLQTPWPLVGGVPFPPGALKSTDHCRVVDGSGSEVPSQIESTAVWQDSSVRWLAVSLVAEPSGSYVLEFGESIKTREAVTGPVAVTASPGGYIVDTGAARFTLRSDALGMDTATMGSGHPLWTDGAAGIYAVDSQGRRATCAGSEADVRWTIPVAGPIRTILRGDAHYVTEQGERVARATIWYWFFRGCAQVKIVHTFVFTRNTDELWFREIGVDIPFRPSSPRTVTVDTSKEHDAAVEQFKLEAGSEIRAVQEDYPHFLERGSRSSISRMAGGDTAELSSGEAMGEWLDLTDSTSGVTVVIRDLAEQFPKSLEASGDGMSVKLWTTISDRELDVRLSTLIPNYFGEWATTFPKGGKTFARQPSNATGAAKTHELWLLPHNGTLDLDLTVQQAQAADERVMLIPDPAWTCNARVLHLEPTQEKDTARFPQAEAAMSDYFDRVTLGLRAFPMTGAIAWGCNPFLQYKRTEDGRWYAGYYRLQYLIEYNLRRNAWMMFARSGDRKYYDYVSRFDWFAADWSMHHENTDKKVKGGFARQSNYHYPIFWGNRSEVLYTECSGTDLFNWYTNYYMTGDLRSLDVIHEYRDAVLREWEAAKKEEKYVAAGSAGFMTLRLLVQLYMETWDPQFREMIELWAHGLFDPESPNGITDKQPYGCLYKVSRNLCSTLEYWWVTKDPAAKECYLKAVDYNRRFARLSAPISYQNGQGAFHTQAYRWTGNTDWLRVPQTLLAAGIADMAARPPLQEALKPGFDNLKSLPYLGPHTNLHPLYAMPIVMKALTEQDKPIGPPAWAVKGESELPAWIVVRKQKGRPCTLDLAYNVKPSDGIEPIVLDSKGGPVRDAQITTEKQHYWRSPSGRKDYTPKPGQPWRVSARVTLPEALPADDYRMSINGPGRVVVVGATVDQCVVECPDGLFLNAGNYGAKVHFDVPKDTAELRLFCTRPLVLTRPDGTRESVDEPGHVTLPGTAGMWSAETTFPTFFRLENVPRVVAATPELHFTPETLRSPTPVPPPIPPDVLYIPGPIGQARHLPDNAVVDLPRGAPRPDGGFANFPGDEGTIELFFRPNWSSRELVFNDRMIFRSFIGSNSTRFYHRYGKGPMAGVYSYVDILIPGRGEGYGTDYGTALRHLFRKAEWNHFAATWKINRTDPKKTKGEFTIFFNGKKTPRDRFYPHALDVTPPFNIRDIQETLTIGPMDGCVDELRVSDTVRYTADFAVPTQPFSPDEHTTALFHFDGDDDGWLRGKQ